MTRENDSNETAIALAKRQGAEDVRSRRDFQAGAELRDQAPIRRATPHHLKIAGYRDRVMRHLAEAAEAKRLDFQLMDNFDRRSLILLDKYADKTELAMYSDLLKYLQYCQLRALKPLPFEDYSVDAYLSHMMAQRRKRAGSIRPITYGSCRFSCLASVFTCHNRLPAYIYKSKIQIVKKVKLEKGSRPSITMLLPLYGNNTI